MPRLDVQALLFVGKLEKKRKNEVKIQKIYR